jgi:hypothetical protein
MTKRNIVHIEIPTSNSKAQQIFTRSSSAGISSAMNKWITPCGIRMKVRVVDSVQ